MALLLVFAFISGLATILAPCIWPVLPIVLSSSIAGSGHKRPLGITLGVIISFAFFTLAISTLVRLFHLDTNILRIIAGIIISFLGITMIFPKLYSQFEIFVTRLSNVFGIKGTRDGNDFLPGLITGLSLGIVWSPCAGPILATIAALAATGKVNLDVVFVTIAYVVGVGIPLFIFAYGGQTIIARLKGLSSHTGQIQKAFGVIMILAALAILTNYDQTLQLKLLNTFPGLGNLTTGFEESSTVTNQLNILKGQKNLNTDIPAPDFTGITNWLNLPAGRQALTMKDLKGKVVLVDFWTYTCINCIRTLPHVTGWYNKYKDDGFVVIGVHTPEFQFEHDANNVENAIKMDGILYPVAQDNNYATWNAYSNEYWPAEYLIDAEGNIRRTDFGEGQYDQMEMAIQELLKEAGAKVTTGITNIPDTTPTAEISPETYLGSDRGADYLNLYSLGGNWKTYGEYILSSAGSTINYNFTASKVYIILRPIDSTHPGKVNVYLDGKLNKTIMVDSDRLYNVIDLGNKTENHTLKLEFVTPGTEAYTFTFG